MPDAPRPPLTDCAPERKAFDPTGIFMPGSVPVTAADWWRKRIAMNLSFLWLAFPVLDMAGSHPSALRVLLTGVGVVAYVIVYNRLPRLARPSVLTDPAGASSVSPPRWGVESMRSAARSLGLLTLIPVVLTVTDRSSWTLMFVFTAISGAMRLARREAALWILFCTLLTAGANVAARADVGSTISLTATTLAIGFMMLAFRQLMDLNRDLMTAREEVARLAVAEERLRFARDLHDLLGHGLTVISIKADLAERLLARDAPEAAATHVTDIKNVARNALREVREAVGGYHKPSLVSELSGARMALQAAGIDAQLQSTDVALDPEVEAVLAWTVREGTTNVIRHSGARNCRIEVQPGPAGASAEVTDDGSTTATQIDGSSGSGLAGLRERAERLAGRLEAGPLPGGGFRLRVTLPTDGAAT